MKQTSLYGTDTRVAQAEAIRTAKIAELDAYLVRIHERLAAIAATGDAEKLAKHEVAMEYIERVVGRCKGQRSATYWIDHRNMSAQNIMLDTADMLGIKE